MMSFFLYLIIGMIASYQDIKNRQVSDIVHLAIILISIPNIDINKIGACIIAFSLFISPNFLKDGAIGGADIKFMAVSGLILGIRNIIHASIVGMLIAVIFTITKDIIRRNKTISIPLIPYLFTGCLVSISIGFL